MVRSLDLSYFTKDTLVDGERPPLAGWREFKYRHHDMFYVHRMSHEASTAQKGYSLRGLGSGKPQPPKPIKVLETRPHGGSSHPPPSPMLRSFHRTRDVPIGGICHVLSACSKLRYVL